ncbi:hypothetical protein C2W62_28785 [Candidatus Entotheonella serta]|nr:hypothetical protein C2W62_28785 [Candidatus Entotheonella serta]
MRTAILAIVAILSGIVLAHANEPLTIWISSQQDKAYYESMVPLYRAKIESGFKAKIQAFGFREMPDKLAAAMKTGVGLPDIVQLDEVFFGMYLHGKPPFVDLTSRIQQADLAKGIVTNRLSLFRQGDAIYGLPQSLSAMLLYYRRDLFEANQVSPERIRTWEDVLSVGEQLAARGQRFLALDSFYFEVMLRQAGSHLFGANGEVLPDMEVAIKVLTYLQTLSKKKLLYCLTAALFSIPSSLVAMSSTVRFSPSWAPIGTVWI